MKETELFEKLKSDIGMIIYTEQKRWLITHYWNEFHWNTYLEVLEKANNYAKDMNWFTID